MNNQNPINHIESMNYENFLSRAFKFDKRIKRQSKQEYLNLIEAEHGNRSSRLPKFEKQLDEIQNRLIKAVDIFISKSKGKEQIRNLEELRVRIELISSFQDIPSIVKFGLEMTQNIKKSNKL